MKDYPGIEYKLDLKKPMSGKDVNAIESELSKLGVLGNSNVDGWFDLYTDRAVRNFQIANHLIPTGVVDKKLWDLLFAFDETDSDSVVNTDINVDNGIIGINPNSRVIVSDSDSHFVSKNETEEVSTQKYDGTEKHTPYFNEYNSKQLRKTNLEMRVDFGANHSMNKTLKGLYMRSAGIEVDASGNPLYETFEFIARDVIENDNQFIKEEE